MGFIKRVGSYIHNVLVGFDQFANTVAGGHPDETISARSGRATAEKHPVGEVIDAGLNVIQKDHCIKAEGGDLARAEIVENLEERAYLNLTPEEQAEFKKSEQQGLAR
jgi:hypothetical protein